MHVEIARIAMTPEQRMELMIHVTMWDSAANHKAAMKVMQELIQFVEHLEFKAHIAGQDHEREIHKEFYVHCEERTTQT